ncbi:MAG: prenyltransferase [Anaerolineae bacterium]|nr:MAG: prenyltransferase [Anaerolineae bacterium]
MTASNWPRQIIAFIRLGRFIFLTGGFILYGLGGAIAYSIGTSIHWHIYLWGQAIVTLTQLMTHYSNDYFDFEADKANLTPTRWSGGSRVLPSGGLQPAVSLYAALILLASGLFLSFALTAIEKPGPFTLPILLTASGLSWAYSSPPFRLHSHGLGEIAAVIILAFLAPLLGFYLQVGEIQKIAVLPLPTLAFLQLNMLLSVHLPDVEGDVLVHKHTLIVLLGRQSARVLYTAALVMAHIWLFIAGGLGLPIEVQIAGSLPLPVALWQLWRIWRGAWFEQKHWENIAFISIGLLMSTAFLQLLAFVWIRLD